MRTRTRAGNPSPFAELFDGYARSVYNHAFRPTADWATAEDVTAQTFRASAASRCGATAGTAASSSAAR